MSRPSDPLDRPPEDREGADAGKGAATLSRRERELVRRLARRSYHLEDDNTGLQDWAQYQKNTHPVFGLCLHHPLHPVRFQQRILILVGSVAFGFAVTNCVYMGFLEHELAGDYINQLYNVTGELAKRQQQYTQIEVEQGTAFLITVGSFLHSVYDTTIWYLLACACFRPEGLCPADACRKSGVYAGFLVVSVVLAAATSVGVASLLQEEQREAQTAAERFAQDHLERDRFVPLAGYALQLASSYLVFYFLTSTVLFLGVLGCGRVPVLGGRPYEIRKQESRRRRRGQHDEERVGDAVPLLRSHSGRFDV